jgi:hypothetical protein
MTDNERAAREWDRALERLAADVTNTAYAIALRHGAGGSWVDLELGPFGRRWPKRFGSGAGTPPCRTAGRARGRGPLSAVRLDAVRTPLVKRN